MVYAFISPIACIPMESKMMENKPKPESDDARSGDDEDKNREELSKAAEKGLKDARRNNPKGDAL
jgi:hypothetical protein